LRRKKLGIIINPVAGLGGKVGLKGTDGTEVAAKARRMGASPESPLRAEQALKVVLPLKDEVDVLSYPGEMGEDVARKVGFQPRVIGSIRAGHTTPEDTQRAARKMLASGVDLLLFAGGDGTARDIYRAVGSKLTVLGVPTGVKMHSAVFAITPRVAGVVALEFLGAPAPGTAEGEVMDIDESSFRKGVLDAKLYGYLRTPQGSQHLQSVKSGGTQTDAQAVQGMATELFRSMERGCLYIFGPGTTTRDTLAQLHLDKTLLGVDVVLDGRLVGRDVNEKQIWELLKGTTKAKIVVTPIGGQGYIFGRGNQQLSARVIRKVGKENIVVIGSKQKLASLGGRPLLVDTGDPRLDESLTGYIRVIVGLGEYVMCRVAG
jgi:predicted polyphosphate/ATP-dependent NAD kinase